MRKNCGDNSQTFRYSFSFFSINTPFFNDTLFSCFQVLYSYPLTQIFFFHSQNYSDTVFYLPKIFLCLAFISSISHWHHMDPLGYQSYPFSMLYLISNSFAHSYPSILLGRLLLHTCPSLFPISVPASAAHPQTCYLECSAPTVFHQYLKCLPFIINNASVSLSSCSSLIQCLSTHATQEFIPLCPSLLME